MEGYIMSTLFYIIEVHLECLLPNMCVMTQGGNRLGFKLNRASIDVKGQHSAVGGDFFTCCHTNTCTRSHIFQIFRGKRKN